MNAELQFLTALQGLHTPARDAVMLFFTRLGNAGFVWIALAAILLLFRRHPPGRVHSGAGPCVRPCTLQLHPQATGAPCPPL